MEKSCFQIFKSGAHNGQKKNKLRTVHMRVITIGFLCFKTLDHSISGKNPANNCKNFFMLGYSFCYAIKNTKTSFFPLKKLNNLHIKENQMLKPVLFQ